VTFADEIDGYMSGCQQHVLRLRILARTTDDTALSRDVAAEIRDATNAIIAQAEAMSRAVIRAGSERDSQAETFVWARLTRLAVAADRAVGAARGGNTSQLRVCLRHFDALTSAIWTVERAAYGQYPVPSQGLRKQSAWHEDERMVRHTDTLG
jgi:hypothetical protein